jgi:hypothetical protein
MKWHNVELLYQKLEPTIKQMSYFASNGKTQSGVLRVNCMDCLDRTNVVESVFAKHVSLERNNLLIKLGVYRHVEACRRYR